MIGLLALSGCKKSSTKAEASPEKKLDQSPKTEEPTETKTSDSPSSSVDELTPNDTIEIPEECSNNNVYNEHGAVQANVLSTQIQNGEPNQFLEYDIFIIDCDRQLKPFSHEPLRFYLEAQSTSMIMDHPYYLSDSSGRELMKGRLKVIVGKDIYGGVGDGRAHTELEPLFLTMDYKRLRLKIDISNIRFAPSFGNPSSDTFTVRTFIGYSKAIPAERWIQFKTKTN